MENADILKPLFEEGDLKQTIELAEAEQKKLFDINSNGMNLVTASVLANIPSVNKLDLIQKTDSLFSSKEYCELLNQKVLTITPEERERLKEQGSNSAQEITVSEAGWYNIFEIAFPWLPLSIFEDFVIYLRDEKKLILDKETIETVRENFLATKKYSERELNALFSSNVFTDPADLEEEE